jgi:hypothetical protein
MPAEQELHAAVDIDESNSTPAVIRAAASAGRWSGPS